MNLRLSSVLSWLVTIIIPLVLILLGMRLLLTPAFVETEYRMPNFPTDDYGFDLKARLYWSKIALQYLLNDADISFLGDLHFEDGSQVYNERELKHMMDVKIWTRIFLDILYATLGCLAVLGVWAWRGKWWGDYCRSLKRGGWLAVALVIAMGLFGALSFSKFFVLFHSLFFEGVSWQFPYSDTLIRLFPVRFWQDAFVAVAAVALLGGIVLGTGLKPGGK
jgi:integral membrane protein (TIGR01906 family)